MFYSKDNYSLTECSRLLIKPVSECSAAIRISRVEERKVLTLTSLIYVLELQLNSNVESSKLFVLSTTFNDLAKFHANLQKIHNQLHLQGTFPSFPPKKLWGSHDADVVNMRKDAINIFLNFILEKNVLRKTCTLLNFFKNAELSTSSSHDCSVNLIDTCSSRQETEESQFIPFSYPNIVLDHASCSTDKICHPSLETRESLNCDSKRQKYKYSSLEDCMLDAAKMIAMAHKVELEGDFEKAFQFYNNVTKLLIQAALLEPDTLKQNAIRKKTAKFLMKAENIYKFYLSYDGRLNMADLNTLSMPHPKESLDTLAFKCSLEALVHFRIIGILPDICSSKRVFLVEDETTGIKSIMKLIEKSSRSSKEQVFLPNGLPHMIELKRFFETDIFVILLLEYNEYGLLWSFLTRYFNECELRSQSALYDIDEIDSWKETQKNEKTLLRTRYSGRRSSFAVEADIHRYVNVSLPYTNEDPSTCEVLCSMGEDCTNPQTTTHSDFFLTASASSVVGMEEDPAFSSFNFGSKIAPHTLPLSENLSEVAHLLTHRKKWPSTSLLPETIVVHWMAQLVSWFYVLHRAYQFYIGNFTPNQILLTCNGNIIVSYFGTRKSDSLPVFIQDGYSAPESFEMGWQPTEASDVWTLGAILFELLTGRGLSTAIPILSEEIEIPIHFYSSISNVGQHLLTCMLCPEKQRYDIDEVRSHPFFASIDWILYDNPRQSFNNPSKVEISLDVPYLKPDDLLELSENQ